MSDFRSQHHSFDIDLAAKYGVHEAILIHHFQHWIRINKKDEKNSHDGRTWTYQTIQQIHDHFPYLSLNELTELIHKLCTGKGRRSKKQELEFEPVLMKGNFNKNPYDHCLWYAFVDEPKWILAQAKIDKDSSQNRKPPKPKSNIDQILNPDTKKEDSYVPPQESEELARYFFSKIKERKADFKEPNLKQWAADMDKLLRIDKRGPEKIKTIIDWVVFDDFWAPNVLSPGKLREKFDNLEMQMKKSEVKDLITQNIIICNQMKQKFPDRCKLMKISGEYVINNANGKDLSLKMLTEAFVPLLKQIFGDRYE